MSLLSVVLLASFLWILVLVFVLSLCRAAAAGDRDLERLCTPTEARHLRLIAH